MNLRPRDIVEGSSGGDCASSTKDDGPENHRSCQYTFETTNQKLYMLEK
jgi:hypothetical protein